LQQFGTAEVSRLTGLPVPSIRAMIRARYVAPSKGVRGALCFSFRDLVLLRTARHLLDAGVSRRRVGDALRALSAQLPADVPARGLSVTSAGGRVIVHEAGDKRDALSGQLLLAFEVRIDGEKVELIDSSPRADVADGASGDDCDRAFEAALQLEDRDVEAAVEAYRTCLAKYSHDGARANLGRLLHLQGRITEALRLYRAGNQSDADVLYNEAVALEDLGRTEEAIATYNRVIELDRDYTDAHHNVARLWEQAGDHRRALRHWNTYRKLSRGSTS
jgi:DNA-binding transcriptional MerR regulator